MAVVFRGPLKAPDFRAYVNAATFAAAIVGIFPSSLTLLAPPVAANPLGSAYENTGPGFLQANVSVLPHGTSGFPQTIRGFANGLNAANRPRPDWPVPKGPAPLNVGFTQGLQLTTLGAVVPANPLGTAVETGGPPFLVPLAQTWTQNLLQTTLGAVAAPFRQNDWLNPRAPQRGVDLGGIQETPIQLIKPFAQNEWLVPRAAAPLNVGDVEGFTSPIRSVATKPIHLDEWPVPKGPAPLNVGFVSGFDSPILDYAIGLNDARKRVDWPNPVLPIYRQQDLITWVQNLLQTTLATVQNPFVQRDWPNPRAAAPLNVGDVEGFPLPLRDYAGGLNDANKRKYDWPNPRGPEPARQAESRGFETPIRSYAGGLNDGKWRNLDWPNPRGPQRSIDALTWTQSLVLGITAQGTKPFHQDDWPLAVPRVYRQIADSTGLSLPILTFSIGLNDGKWRNLDWPNPRGAVPNQPLSWTVDLQQTPFTSPPVPAPAQRDWPNPGLGKPPLNVGWVQGFPQPVLNYAVGLNDGRWRNLDWPVPRGAQRPVDLLTWIGPKTQLAPFAQYDWPVPKGLGPRQADSLGFPEPVRDYAVGLNTANKRPSDWPVPKGAQRSIDALTWTQTLALQISQAPVKPFAQNDWPLPNVRVYSQVAETRGFETPIRNYAVGLNNAAKRKYDWPNPIGRPPLNVGFVQGFPQPVQAAQVLRISLRNYDWPVPKGKPPLNVGWVAGFDAAKLGSYVPFAYLRNYDWPVPKGPVGTISLRFWSQSHLQDTLTPSPFIPVCAHVEVLFPSAEVMVLFGTADLEALASTASVDVLVADAETDVLAPEAVTTIDECPGGEVVVPPITTGDECNRVTEAGEDRVTEDGQQRIVEECGANVILLEDNTSLLLEDGTSEVLLE